MHYKDIIKENASDIVECIHTEPFQCGRDLYWKFVIVPKTGHGRLQLGLQLDRLPQDVRSLAWMDINASKHEICEFALIGDYQGLDITNYVYFKHLLQKKKKALFKIFLTILDTQSTSTHLWYYSPSTNIIKEKQFKWRWKLDENTLTHCKQCEPCTIFSDYYCEQGLCGIEVLHQMDGNQCMNYKSHS